MEVLIAVVIGLAVVTIFFSVVILSKVSYRSFILYSLAAVVSLVGINIHIGVTFYLQRIVIIFFLVYILMRALIDRPIRYPFKFLSTFLYLFSFTILVQFIAVLFSPRFLDGFRWIFIYLSMMAIFITVIVVGTKIEIIIKAIKIYLAIGFIQGVYGIYQIIGAPFSWPTFQTLMAGIPTANDRTVGGYYYSGAYNVFRSTGFFPADVSVYAGYMTGILLLAIAFISYNRRSIFPYLVIMCGVVGLSASLSRSGIIAFIVFGLPSLFLLLRYVHRSTKWFWWLFAQGGILLVVLGFVIIPLLLEPLSIDFSKTTKIISTRFEDLLNPGVNKNESMDEHIMTKIMALKALVSSPLIGVGLGVNAAPWYPENDKKRGWAGSHSHHLDILGQTGLLGASLQWIFMGIVGLYMWGGLKLTHAGKQERILLAGLLSTYITILLGNFFYHYYMNDFVWFLMGCGVALSRAIRYKDPVIANFDIMKNKQIDGKSSMQIVNSTAQ
jgi:hypothetical protein